MASGPPPTRCQTTTSAMSGRWSDATRASGLAWRRNRRRQPTGEIQIRSSANTGRRAGNVGGAPGFSRKCACSQRNGRPHKYHSFRSPMRIVGCGLFALDRGEQPLHLLAPFSGTQAQMRRQDAQRIACADVDPDIERAARLVGVDRQIEVSHALERMAREHGIAEFRPASLEQRSRGDVIAGRVLQVDEKVAVRALQRHFLQRHHVGFELGQHVDDPRRRVAAVGAHRAMDVPCARRAASSRLPPAILPSGAWPVQLPCTCRHAVRVSLRRERAAFA